MPTSTPLAPAFRPATPGDAAAIAALGERSFRETFGPHNTAEDMNAYCAAAYALDRQRQELADPARLTLVVECGGELAGYAQLLEGPAPPSVMGPDPIELLRFYIDSPFHGRGLARALMAEVLAAARQRGARTLYLAVWERNLRAIAFYAKEGFCDVGEKPFLLGSDLQNDRVMVLPLGALPRLSPVSTPPACRPPRPFVDCSPAPPLAFDEFRFIIAP